MTLPTYSSFDVQLDKFLGDAIRAVNGQAAVWAPACNVYEDADHFWVEALVPGMDAKNIDITIEEDVLTIKGDRNDASEERSYLAHEISSGPFARSFRLPQHVESSRVSASYKNGVLRVELPKREELKPRRIPVE